MSRTPAPIVAGQDPTLGIMRGSFAGSPALAFDPMATRTSSKAGDRHLPDLPPTRRLRKLLA